MANQNDCYTSLQLCALRVARLTATGAPDDGASNGYVTDASISLGVSLEIATGDDFEQKDGCGNICASYRGDDRIKRANLSLVLCQFDLALIALLTGSDTFSSASKTVGFQLPASSSTTTRYVSVEAWTKAWDSNAQAVPTFTSPAPAYYHWVFPKVRWTIGDITMENGLMNVPLNGIAEENSEITSNGPFDDWPSSVSGPGGITRVYGNYFDSTLPTATCDYIAVSSAAS